MPNCPRDGAALEVAHRADQRFEIDVCKTCGGVWLDSHELAGLCPTAAHLPERRDEAVLAAVAAAPDLHSRGIASCPRCSAKPHQLVLAGLAVDFCHACGGVWLDADEAASILRDPPKEQAARPRSATPFRETALDIATTGSSRCVACGERTEAKKLFARPEGFVCIRCNLDVANQQAWDRAFSSMKKDPTFWALPDALIELASIPKDIVEHVLDVIREATDGRPRAWREMEAAEKLKAKPPSRE